MLLQICSHFFRAYIQLTWLSRHMNRILLGIIEQGLTRYSGGRLFQHRLNVERRYRFLPKLTTASSDKPELSSPGFAATRCVTRGGALSRWNLRVL